jgi:hypothetical protein
MIKLLAERTSFTEYPQISWDEPMVDTEFYSWVKSRDKGTPKAVRNDVFVPAFLEYLEGHGYDRRKHLINKGQLEIHRNIFQYYYWVKHNVR